MRQTLILYRSTIDNYIVKTVSESTILDLTDGDYTVSAELSSQLSDTWGEIDMSGCNVRVING